MFATFSWKNSFSAVFYTNLSYVKDGLINMTRACDKHINSVL